MTDFCIHLYPGIIHLLYRTPRASRCQTQTAAAAPGALQRMAAPPVLRRSSGWCPAMHHAPTKLLCDAVLTASWCRPLMALSFCVDVSMACSCDLTAQCRQEGYETTQCALNVTVPAAVQLRQVVRPASLFSPNSRGTNLRESGHASVLLHALQKAPPYFAVTAVYCNRTRAAVGGKRRTLGCSCRRLKRRTDKFFLSHLL